MMGRPSWFKVSFSGGLDVQQLTITQACQFGTELGWFADPSDGTQQCKCSILHLTQAQSFS